jgi:hypothetical protein
MIESERQRSIQSYQRIERRGGDAWTVTSVLRDQSRQYTHPRLPRQVGERGTIRLRWWGLIAELQLGCGPAYRAPAGWG